MTATARTSTPTPVWPTCTSTLCSCRRAPIVLSDSPSSLRWAATSIGLLSVTYKHSIAYSDPSTATTPIQHHRNVQNNKFANTFCTCYTRVLTCCSGSHLVSLIRVVLDIYEAVWMNLRWIVRLHAWFQVSWRRSLLAYFFAQILLTLNLSGFLPQLLHNTCCINLLVHVHV